MYLLLRRRCVAAGRQSTGFTLIELMAVIAIIGILAGIILGISGYVSRKADFSRVQGDLERIKIALEEYKVDHGKYVPAGSPLSGLTNYVSDLRFSDPWTRAYNYTFIGNSQFRLWSTGPDGVNGTADDIESTKAAF